MWSRWELFFFFISRFSYFRFLYIPVFYFVLLTVLFCSSQNYRREIKKSFCVLLLLFTTRLCSRSITGATSVFRALLLRLINDTTISACSIQNQILYHLSSPSCCSRCAPPKPGDGIIIVVHLWSGIYLQSLATLRGTLWIIRSSGNLPFFPLPLVQAQRTVECQ